MNEKKIKVNASIGNLGFDVYVTVPQDAWDKEIDYLEEEVRGELSDSEWDDEFDVNEYDSIQELMESQLVWNNPYCLILDHLGALEQLRDAIIEDLAEGDTEHQFEHELQMSCSSRSGTIILKTCWTNWQGGLKASKKSKTIVGNERLNQLNHLNFLNRYTEWQTSENSDDSVVFTPIKSCPVFPTGSVKSYRREMLSGVEGRL